jgi:hypothetical protein
MHKISILFVFAGLGLIVWFVAVALIAGGDGCLLSPAAGAVLADGQMPWSDLVVTPTVLLAEVPAGQQEERDLFVSNMGPTATLVYTISVLSSAPLRGIVDWLSVTPTHGTIPTASRTVIDVTFDATDKPPGFLDSASLRVDSNSLVTPTAITVPVHLFVVEASIEVTWSVFLPVVLNEGVVLEGADW